MTMAHTPGTGGAFPEPTEQLPMESAPVSARSAASGGATGLDASGIATGPPDDSDGRKSIVQRHPLAIGVAAGVVLVVLVSGLTAWGVSAAVTASLTSSSLSEAPTGSSAGALTAAGAASGVAAIPARLVFRATITAMNGTSWSVMTKKGTTEMVTVNSATLFGTKAVPETAGSFVVGDSVLLVATKNPSGVLTVTRVVKQT